MSRVLRRKKASSVKRYVAEAGGPIVVFGLTAASAIGAAAWWAAAPIFAGVVGYASWRRRRVSGWTALVHDLAVSERRTQAAEALIAMLRGAVEADIAMKMIAALAEAGFDQAAEAALARVVDVNPGLRAYATSLLDVRAGRVAEARAAIDAVSRAPIQRLGAAPNALEVANAMVLVAEGNLDDADCALERLGLPGEVGAIAGVEPPWALLPLRIRAIHADLALARGERGRAFALLQVVEPGGLAWLAHHPGLSREIAADLVARRGAFR